MKIKNGYTIVELTIIVIVLSIFLGLFVNINIKKDSSELKKVISNINSYNISIGNFKKKYGFLPGDIKKTQVFNLSKTNTDGNENNLIEDLNQQVGINNQNLRMDAEISNFWLHLYRSGIISREKTLYPFLKYFNSGILVFSKNNKNYFHIGINNMNNNNEIELSNILTPYQAYKIDQKIDDGLPKSGSVLVYGGKYLNNSIDVDINKYCATDNEYLTKYNKKFCQVIIELKI